MHDTAADAPATNHHDLCVAKSEIQVFSFKFQEYRGQRLGVRQSLPLLGATQSGA